MLRLSQIELLGFKSFPHKTTIDFDAGVTCIVGPNGSGKSNIGDAIQFAFGSQSGHELRAQRLNQLIFAGTDQLRQLNLASVTLHFECTSAGFEGVDPDDLEALGSVDLDDLDLPEIATASIPVGSKLLEQTGHKGAELTSYRGRDTSKAEDRIPQAIRELANLVPGQSISVTRRVFRDGSGGYFVNDDPVRLKDIDYLFNRFNLGRSAVFSVSQGEVEKKILSTPQEMRDWLAEATGVALLLQQKSRAQSRLKRTRQNLDRLEDIRVNTRELVTDLAAQREIAEKYQQLAAELRSVELYEIRREIEFSQRQQESSAKAKTEVEAELALRTAELGELRSGVADIQHSQKQTEVEIGNAEQAFEQVRQQLAETRQGIAVARETVAAGASAVTQARTDLAELESQQVELSTELQANKTAHEQAGTDSAAAREEETSCKQALEQSKLDLEQAARHQGEVSQTIFNLAQEVVKTGNEITSLTDLGSRVSDQLQIRETQAADAQQKLEQAQHELEEQAGLQHQLELEFQQISQQLEQKTTGISSQLSAIGTLEQSCTELRSEIARLTSRKLTLEELVDPAAHPDSGPGFLLGGSHGLGEFKRAMEISFPEELRPAFTRLLAHIEDAVIGNQTNRDEVRQRLAAESRDALVLYENDAPENHPQSLWRSIKGDPVIVNALRVMTGDVLLADDVGAADQLLVENPAIRAVVISDGSALIGRTFSYLGEPAPERALRVAQHSDAGIITKQLSALAQELKAEENRHTEAKSALAKLQWERDEITAKLAGIEERRRTDIELSGRLQRSLKEREEACEVLTAQVKMLASDHAELTDQLPVKQADLAELNQQQTLIDSQADEVAREHLAAGARLEDARIALSRCATRREVASQLVRHLETQGFDLAERSSNLRNRAGQLQQRIADTETELERNSSLIAESSGTISELESLLADAGAGLSTLKESRHALNSRIEQQQSVIDGLLQNISRLEQNLITSVSQFERATERVAERLDELQQRFSLTLSELIADPTVAAPPPAANLDAAEAGRGKLREEKSRLSELIDQLGPVNLLAIEQHIEHSTHLAFLDSQAEDLLRAVDDLSQLVEDLDQQTERQYKKNLRKIESRFNEIYLRLFESGWARLRFEEPEDIINSGVEVEVQLPGTRRHQLRSLSGGQRSLIFLALFFAVHSVRSPGFCILDEADAALDDANVERFTTLIREYSQDEQFIVITHNKMTMETADKLIGVVGRPKGVSNLLEVDMKQARRMIG